MFGQHPALVRMCIAAQSKSTSPLQDKQFELRLDKQVECGVFYAGIYCATGATIA